MVDKARHRLKLCGLADEVDVQSYNGNKFPFDSNSFNKIYAESVFGIQEGRALVRLLKEVYRTLDNNGSITFNETIWLSDVAAEDIKTYNDLCKTQWGTIQANALFPYVDDWKKLLGEIGFKTVTVHNISGQSKKRNAKELISKAFTSKGDIALRLGLSGRKQRMALKNFTKEIPFKNQMMEGVIFNATK